MNRSEILAREARGRNLAGWTAVAAAPVMIVATAIRQGANVPLSGLSTEQFRAIDDASNQILIATLLTAVAFLLTIPMLLYLFRAAQARNDRVSTAMIGFVYIGPILLAIQQIVGFIYQQQVAQDFITQSVVGGDIYTLLDDLIDESTLAQFSASLYIPASIGFVVAAFYVPLQALRVGLLTRMTGTLGMALGVATIVLPPAVLALMIWFGWVGFMVLDKTPKGMPPAWAAGEAMPWPKAGEEPVRPAAAAEAPIEGDATEVFGDTDESRDHSARRERARKKKRKRRR
jgi:hypothetical protein